MDPLILPSGVVVPERALELRFARSGGPGGQNVNKVESKVEIRVDLDAIEGLAEPARERLRERVRNRLDAEGRWIVTSDRTRDQRRNLEDALEKVAREVEAARIPPKVRTATRPTRASQRRRVEGKRRDAERKQGRRKPGLE